MRISYVTYRYKLLSNEFTLMITKQAFVFYFIFVLLFVIT